MNVVKYAWLVLIVALVPTAASAQDTPKVGLTMGYPAAVGLIWQLADRVALRPEVTLTKQSDESTQNDLAGSAPLTSSDSTAASVAIGALFYVASFDLPAGAPAKAGALRAYVSPRFSYSRSSSSSSTPSSTIAGPSTSDSTISAYQTSGSFGAQYTLGRRFGVFGEAGLAYVRTNTSISSTFSTTFTSITNGVLTQSIRVQTVGSSARSNAVTTRTAVGVIFFF